MVNPAGHAESAPTVGRTRCEPGVVLAYLACIVIWGTTWTAVRLCVLPGGLPPYTAVAVRFAFAAVFLVALFSCGVLRARLNDRTAGLWITLSGLIGVVSMALVYNAQRSISGGLAAILATTAPLVTALLATATRTEKVSRASLIGAVCSLAGIVVLFGDRLNVSAAQATGILLLLGSVTLNALSSVVLKRVAGNESPLVSVSLYVIVSVVSFGILGLSFEHTNWTAVNMVSIAAAAYLGIVGSVGAFACYFYLLKRVRLMTISTMVFFPPVIALLVDTFIEKDVQLSLMSYAGIGITVTGVLIGVLLRTPSKPDSGSEAVGEELIDTSPLDQLEVVGKK
jgi:drug/metabolite transporter (DMT)-like permease